MIELFSYTFSVIEIATLMLVAMLIGMAKTGVAGVGMIAVPLAVLLFGGKESTGFLLPILIFADVFAVKHYHSHANWDHLKRLLPFAIIGVFIGTALGEQINDELFRLIMALIIFASLGIVMWQERVKEPKIPTSIWFVSGIGIIGGVTSMVGNLAGPIMALYLLAMQFPKNQFIGTAAWFFFTINLLKVPFHVVVWETITLNSFLLDVALLPAIALGAYIGIKITKIIPEKAFRLFILFMTAVAAIAMLL